MFGSKAPLCCALQESGDSMEAFWKWLMRANARVVFFCSLSAFVVVSGWWTWMEFAPVDYETRIPPTTAREKSRPNLDLLAFLEKQLSSVASPVSNNPFLSPETSESVTQISKPAPPEPAPLLTPETREQSRPTMPSPTQKPETVILTYRGIFIRSDGHVMALIEDSRTKRSSFYNIGDNLYGVKIVNVKTEQAAVVLSDESSVTLKLGKPEVFKEGRHAD